MAVQPQQPIDPLSQYAKVLGLKSLLGQQALQPGQQQIQQQQIQQEQIQTQEAQNKVKSQNAMIAAWSDPKFTQEITGGTSQNAQPNGPGFDPNAMMQGLIKRGVLPQDANTLVNSFVDRSAKVSDTVKNNAAAAQDQINTYSKALDNLTGRLSSIYNMPVSKAGPAFDALKQDLAQNPLPGMSPQEASAFQASTLDHLPAFINMGKVESNIADYHKSEADAAVAQQKVIPPGGGLSPESQQQVSKDVALATNPAVQQGKVDVATAEGRAKAQVELAMEPMRLQLQQQFGNQKDARDKIETSVLKPYQDKMSDITMARNAVNQAMDNPVAARAATFKMIGVAQPTGSHRVIPAEIQAFRYPGNVGQRSIEAFNDFLLGKPFTSEAIGAMNSFIDGQEQAARTNLGGGIDNVNKLYGTNVGTQLKTGNAAPQQHPFFSKFGGQAGNPQ